MRNSNPSLVLRRAREDDLDGLFGLAKAAGAGMTNLPPDRPWLAQRIRDSVQAPNDAPPALALFVLQADDRIAGAAAVWPRVGALRPFYSFRIDDEAEDHEAHALQVLTRTLTLTTAFTGLAEVGGLIVDPARRSGGAGRLAARARYLFIAEHRDWFPDRVLAELRGWQDAEGRSPVWEALGRPIFGLPFAEADRQSIEGFDLIGAMAPRHPIDLGGLDEAARAAIGRPHDDSRGALRLLLEEGFEVSHCVDVFDGGPTVVARVDEIAAVRDNRPAEVIGCKRELSGPDHLVSTGAGQAFRAARGGLRREPAGVVLDADLAGVLGVGPGDRVRHVQF